MKPRLLDLFCGAGGAAMGYHRAGFDVVGVDIAPQPDYPFRFIQADAIREVALHGRDGWIADVEPGFRLYLGHFAAIHASPPCQHASSLRSLWPDRHYPALIEPTRDRLIKSGLPYVIENVVGAALRSPALLCGSMIGAPIRRHRLFETNWPLMVPACQHGVEREIVGVYGASDGDHPEGFKHPGRKRGPHQATTKRAREVMEMPWATKRRGITEAIPPAYTELIGHQLMAHVKAPVTA